MGKELTVLEEMDISSMSEGEILKFWQRSRNVTPKSKVNTIFIDNVKLLDSGDVSPTFGQIFGVVYEKGEDGTIEEKKVEIPIGAEFFPIVARVKVSGRDWYEDEEGNQRPEYDCQEVEMQQDIEVYSNKEKKVVYVGQYKDVKDKYKLKWQVVLYVEYNGNVYRWKLNCGATLTNWFNVDREISNANTPHTVIISEVKSANNKSIFWNDINFKLGKPYGLKQMMKYRLAVHKLINKENSETNDENDELADFSEDEESTVEKKK